MFTRFIPIIRLVILVFFLLAAINLIIEFLHVSKNYFNDPEKILIKNIHVPIDTNERFLKQHAHDIVKGYERSHYLFSVGPVQDFTQSLSFKGLADGRRVTPMNELQGKNNQGILLGASQSWGYFVPENKIVSQVLMDRLGDVGIDNYSILGFNLQQIIRYSRAIKNELIKKDFTLVIGGVADVLNYCYVEPLRFYSGKTPVIQMGLALLYNKIKNIFSSPSDDHFCSTPEERQLVIQRVIDDIHFMISEARDYGINIIIVIPPVPFLDGANVNNLEMDPSFSKLKDLMLPVYESYSTQIDDINSKNVVNLMHIFDGDELYFMDSNGHMTEKGHEKLAEEIINHVGESYFKSNKSQ